ncbi:MAG: alpha/beta family hydrolase [Cytophagales bacterium]|nr:alpha/beta family hydrolase [Cytophagales bacterium]
MPEKKVSILVSKAIGKVSAKVIAAKKAKGVLMLAHGAGAGMDHPFMKALAEELEKLSVTTIRYNFPYMENKKGRPDMPAVATATVGAVAKEAKKLFPKFPLFVSGKSFGGRMTSHWVSKENPVGVQGLVFYGFPLHAPGAPSKERAEHLYTIVKPLLFLQGTRDTLADLTLLKKVCKKLAASTLVTFEKADHSFKAGKDNLIPKLAAVTVEWMGGIV